jgi:hypothetical protein
MLFNILTEFVMLRDTFLSDIPKRLNIGTGQVAGQVARGKTSER